MLINSKTIKFKSIIFLLVISLLWSPFLPFLPNVPGVQEQAMANTSYSSVKNIDGSLADWTETAGKNNEEFVTSMADAAGNFHVSWDATYAYFAVSGTSNELNNLDGSRNLNIYLGGDGGATTINNHYSPDPTPITMSRTWNLPFTAKYHIRYQYGSTNASVTGDNELTGTFMFSASGNTWSQISSLTGVQVQHTVATNRVIEMRVPLSLIGNPKTMQFIAFQAKSDGRHRLATPKTLFTEGGDFDTALSFANTYYEVEFASPLGPVAQAAVTGAPDDGFFGFQDLASPAVTQTTANFSWTAQTGASTVKIQQSADGATTWADSSTASTLSASSNAAQVTGLCANTSYKFRLYTVGATNTGGGANIGTSSLANLRTLNDTTAPSIPSGLGSSAVTATSLNLSWAASTDTGGACGAITYEVFRNGVSQGTTTSTNMNITGLAEYTLYDFTIRARDGLNNTSVASNALSVRTADETPPTVPTALGSSSITNSGFTIAWNASTDSMSGMKNYKILNNGNLVTTVTHLSQSPSYTYNFTGLGNYSLNAVTVVAVDNQNNESTAASISVRTRDPFPPTAPTNLAGSEITSSGLKLTWTAATDTGGSGIHEYRIFTSAVSNVNGSQVNTSTQIGQTFGTEFVVTGLSEYSSYTFLVRATDADGNVSDASNTIQIRTLDVTAPSAPTGLSNSNTTATSYTLNWVASNDPDGSGIKEYKVYHNGTLLGTTAGTSYNITGLDEYTEYSNRVVAVDNSDNESAMSVVKTHRTSDVTAPTVPTGLTSSSITSTSFRVSWDASTDSGIGFKHYQVLLNGVSQGTTTNTFYDFTGLDEYGLYSVTVRSVDNATSPNVSASSAALSVRTSDVTAPTKPAGLATANATDNSFDLTWTASTDTGIAGITYDVYKDGVKVATTSTNSYGVTGVVENQQYNFYVIAKDASGNTSVASDTFTITWSIVRYTVTFASNGGNAVISQVIPIGGKASSVTPTRTGYSFAGWFTDAGLTSSYNFDSAVNSDFTLYAKWNINSYTFQFNSFGGSSVTAQTVNHGSTATEPEAPTRAGFTFVGWFTTTTYTTPYNFSSPVNGHTIVYAKWFGNNNLVSFNSNGGTAVASQSVAYEANAVVPTAPTKAGFTFAGWYADENLSSVFSFSTTPITDPITLYAKWANNAPSDIALSANTISENSIEDTVIGTLTATDIDTSPTLTYSLVNGSGATNNASFNINGNQLRSSISFNFEAKSSYSIRVQVSDGELTYEEVFTVTVTDAPEAPSDISLSHTSVAENSPINTSVANLSNNDPDKTDTLTYSLVSGAGSTDNGQFVIVNDVLRTNAVFDFETKNSYSIRVRVSDGSNTHEKSFTLNVTNVNEAPTDIALSSQSIAENAGANATVGTLSSTDVDASSTFSYQLITGTGSTDNGLFNILNNQLRANNSFDFETKSSYTVRVSVSDGGLTYEEAFTISITNVNEAPSNVSLNSLTVPENSGIGAEVAAISGTDVDAGTMFTYNLVTGDGDTDNASFSVSGNKLLTAADFNFENRVQYSIRLQVSDGSLSYAKEFTISVTDVNEAPTNILLSNGSIAENSGINFEIGTLTASDVDQGSTFTYSLVTGTGSDDNSSFNISTDKLRANGSFDFETKQNYSIRIRVSDGTLTFDKVFSINVTNLNEAPTDILLSNSSIAENNASDAPIGSLTATDQDAGTSFTFSLVAGDGDTDNNSFSITGNTLQASTTFDFETKNSYTVRIQASDGGLTYEESFVISVTNANEAPTDISLSNASVAENSGANAAVGTLSATDPDVGATFTFSLVSGDGATDNANFNISGTSLRATGSFNYEAKSSHSIRVRVTDGSLSFEEVFGITVTDVNETPTDISLSSNSLAENSSATAVVGTLTTTDPDESSSFSYALVSGPGDTNNDKFSIVGDVLRAAESFNFEAKSSYSIRVQVTDNAGLIYSKAFTVTITNINEAATDITLSNTLIAENSGENAPVGTLGHNDPDAGNTLTFTLVNGAGDADNGLFNISGTSLRATGSLDFEAKSSFTVRVRVSDGNLGYEKSFAITVTNANEAPTLTTISILNGATEDASFTISYADLMTAAVNENDEDGDNLIFVIQSVASGTLTKNGSAVTPNVTTINSEDSVVWTPAANANGVLNAFTVAVRDSIGATSTPGVMVRVNTDAVNDAPALPSVNTLTGALQNQTYEITFANLLAAAQEADIDSGTFSFRIEEIIAGTLTKNGNPVVAGTDTLTVGESLVWTPVLNAKGLIAGFRIRVSDGSLFSTNAPATVSMNVGVDSTPPSVPTDLTASNIAKNSITLTWDEVIDNGIGTVTYVVLRSNVVLGETTNTTYTMSNLFEFTDYANLRVRARDAAGNISNPSAAINVKTLDGTAPFVPTNVAIGNKTGTSFSISWDAAFDSTANGPASGVVNYEVQVGNIELPPTASTTITATGLTPFTLYDVRIRAVDAQNNKSNWTTLIPVRTNDTIAPSNLTGLTSSLIDAYTFTISWEESTDNVGVTGYEIYFGDNKVAETKQTTMKFDDLTINTLFEVKVRAKDAAGNLSVPGTLDVTTVDTTKPTPPSIVGASNKTQSSFVLNWYPGTDNVGIVKYIVKVEGEVVGETPDGETTQLTVNVSLGEKYDVEVLAVDAAGNVSDPSTSELDLTDITPPTWPPNTAVSVVSRTFESITLTWTAGQDDVENGVLGYIVTVTGGPGQGAFATETNQLTVENLRPDTEYTFTVIIRDKGLLESEATEPFKARTVKDVTLPTTPGSLTATDVTETAMILEWQASTDNDTVTHYNVYGELELSPGVFRSSQLLKANVKTTSTSITGLLPNRKYRISVRALDRAPNFSDAATVLVTTNADTIEPVLANAFTPVATEIRETQLRLNWNDAVFTDNVDTQFTYEVYINNVKVPITFKVPFTDKEFLVRGLQQDTEYQFKIRALDSSGNGAYTGVLVQRTAKDDAAPAKPAVTVGKPASSQVRITWTAVGDSNSLITNNTLPIAKYRVYVAEPNGTEPLNWIMNDEVPVSSLAFVVRGLKPATTGYRVKVVAVDFAGNESPTTATDEKVFNTPSDAIAPVAPTGLKVDRKPNVSDAFILSWLPSTDNVEIDGYRVFFLPAGAATSVPWTLISGTELIKETSFEVTSTLVSMINQPAGVHYRVVAVDTKGLSSTNNSASVRTGFLVKFTDETAPGAPGTVSVNNATRTATSFEITWTAAIDPTNANGSAVTSSGISRYEIYRDNELIGTTPGSVLKFLVTGLTANATFDSEFSVIAVDGAGNKSSAVILAQATTTADTVRPSRAAVVLISKTYKSLTFRLTATDNIGVAKYQYRIGKTGPFIDATGPTLTITGLKPKQTVSISVKAVDAVGNESALLTTASGTTDDDTSPPSAPINAVGEAFTTSVLLRWGAASDNFEVHQYRIYTRQGTSWKLVDTVPSTQNNYEVLNLLPDKGYRFVVRAVDLKLNESGNSNTVIINTLAEMYLSIPTPVISIKTPINTAPGEDGSTFTIEWDKPTGVTVIEYYLYLNGVKINTPKSPCQNADCPSPTKDQWVISKLTPGAQYTAVIQYKVSDEPLILSAFSNSVQVEASADTKAPNAPTSASSDSITATGLRLKWAAADDNVAIKEYNIYDHQDVKIGTTTDLFYPISGLTKDTAYVYRVKSVDTANQESSTALQFSVKTAKDTTAPSVPTVTSISDQIRLMKSVDYTINWQAAVDDTVEADEIFIYNVFINGKRVNKDPITTTSFVVKGRPINTKQQIVITVTDIDNNTSSIKVAPYVFTTMNDDTKPITPSEYSISDVSSTDAVVKWEPTVDDIGIIGYRIYSTEQEGRTLLGQYTKTSAVVKLKPATNYVLHIVAVDAAGNESDPLITEPFSTGNDTQNPEQPTGLIVQYLSPSGGTPEFQLTWNNAYDNDALKHYIIKSSDNIVIKTVLPQTGATTTTTIPESHLGKTIMIVAVDRSDRESENNYRMKLEKPTTEHLSTVQFVRFSNLYTRQRPSVSYRTTDVTRMTLRVFKEHSSNQGTKGDLVRTVLNNVTQPRGSKTINIPALVEDGNYIIELVITNGLGEVTQSRVVTALLRFERSVPKITPERDKVYLIKSGDTSLKVDYTLDRHSIVNIDIMNEDKVRVRTIHRSERLAKRATGDFFNWDLKNSRGFDVPDGVYSVVFSGRDLLGQRIQNQTLTITIQRNLPVVTLVNTRITPGKSFVINYNLSEAANVLTSDRFKLCSNAPVEGEAYVCSEVAGVTITGDTGRKNSGANKFKLETTTGFVDGATYYLYMSVRDLDSPANVNENKIFPIVVDGVRPTVTNLAAENVVGNNGSAIQFKLSELSRVTAVLRSGATRESSKVVTTIASNLLLSGSADEEDFKMIYWNGKGRANRTLQNSSSSLKYFIEVTATDVAGNRTQTVQFVEITKS